MLPSSPSLASRPSSTRERRSCFFRGMPCVSKAPLIPAVDHYWADLLPLAALRENCPQGQKLRANCSSSVACAELSHVIPHNFCASMGLCMRVQGLRHRKSHPHVRLLTTQSQCLHHSFLSLSISSCCNLCQDFTIRIFGPSSLAHSLALVLIRLVRRKLSSVCH